SIAMDFLGVQLHFTIDLLKNFDFQRTWWGGICAAAQIAKWQPLLIGYSFRSGPFQPHFFLTGQKETVSTRQRKTPVSLAAGRMRQGDVTHYQIYLVTRPADNVGRIIFVRSRLRTWLLVYSFCSVSCESGYDVACCTAERIFIFHKESLVFLRESGTIEGKL
ncbi:MAG: hypothetical protein LUD79_08795, partial [Oscillospiraceae bacterium]|nr:hypothetical protein [Oscillospiraceae bacterium]